MQISGLAASSYVPGTQGVSDRVTSFAYADVLTDGDKALVKAATGRDFSTTPPAGGDKFAVPVLAATIAISRQLGTLKGPVTQSFLEQYSNDLTFKAGEIAKAIDAVRSSSETRLRSHLNAVDILG